MKNLQVALVQPNFKIGGGSFVGYWLPYSVGCLWSYASQYDWVQESFILKGERESKERRARAEQKRQLEEESALETTDPAGEVNDPKTPEELTTESEGADAEAGNDLDDSDNTKVEEPETPEEE